MGSGIARRGGGRGLSERLGRRELLLRGGGLAAAAAGLRALPAHAAPAELDRLETWTDVRRQFALVPGVANFAIWLLASHPRSVREAIQRHRRDLDASAKLYLDARETRLEEAVLAAASRYLGASSDEIALTDSTTMGLGLLYGGIRLRRGDVVLTSEHDFYATHESLRLRAQRDGVRVERVRLYDRPARASVTTILGRLRAAIGPKTRVVALTWVHSSTGVKLPIREIAALVHSVNRRRRAAAQVRLCVDGVHGFGVENATPRELGCDALVSGCHKWLFGPRGTGLVWASSDMWALVSPTIPSFAREAYGAWLFGTAPTGPPGRLNTPGGYHTFEHRWALAEAFGFQLALGKERVEQRTHALAQQLKDGLQGARTIELVTPRSAALSAGLVCLEPQARSAEEVVERLWSGHRILASLTPYRTRYVRLGPSIVNTEDEVEKAVRALRAVA